MLAPAVDEIQLNALHWPERAHGCHGGGHSVYLLTRTDVAPVHQRLLHKSSGNEVVHCFSEMLVYLECSCVEKLRVHAANSVGSAQVKTNQEPSLFIGNWLQRQQNLMRRLAADQPAVLVQLP